MRDNKIIEQFKTRLKMKKVVFSFFIACLFTAIVTGQATIQDGIQMINNENYGDALNFFNNLAKDPKNDKAQYYIGKVKYILEDYAGAEAAFNKGLQIDDRSMECQVGSALLKLDNNKPLEAEKIFENVVKHNKKNAAAFAMIGDAYLYSKHPDATKAIEYLKKSRDMDPKVGATWAHLGDAYKLAGESGNAMTSYEFAVEKDKTNLEAYMSMAKIWANSGQLDLGIEKLESAIKLAPNYAPAYKSLYELYIRKRAFDKVTQ